MKHYHGEQFDCADYTEKELRERFPDEFEEFNEARKEAWKADPKYYCDYILAQLNDKESDLRDCRNELCLRCGNYREKHLGACDGCRWKEGDW